LDKLPWFNKADPVLDEPADRLYNEGLYLLNEKKDIKAAAKRFEEVDRQNPYSDWARKSLIMVAYSRYEAKDYDECIFRYTMASAGSKSCRAGQLCRNKAGGCTHSTGHFADCPSGMF
jgi:hypothetical protein